MTKLFHPFLLLAIMLASATVYAQNEDHFRLPPEMRNLRFGLYMAENNLFEARFLLHLKQEIALSDNQIKKIESLMIANEERSIRDSAELKIRELKFAALLKNEKINRKEMEKIIREIGQLRTDTQIKHLNYLVDLKELLTAEQIKKLEQVREQLHNKMPGHRLDRLNEMNEKRPDKNGAANDHMDNDNEQFEQDQAY